MRRFHNKTVFITGASSGIGRALATQFAYEGANLVVFARRIDRLNELAKELRLAPEHILIIQGDVTKKEDLDRAMAQALAKFVKVDVVIANAGFGVAGNLDDLEVQDYERQFNTNVFGLLKTVYASLDALKNSKGTLVLIGSVASYVALPGGSPYAMSKAAVRSFAESIHPELKAQGVSVVLISPGFVESEIREVDNQGVHRAGSGDPVMKWLVMPTHQAAAQMVDAIALRKREAIITFHGKLAVFVYRHFPWVLRFAQGWGLKSRKEAKKNPQELGTPGGQA